VDRDASAVERAAEAIEASVPGATVLALAADLAQESEARRAVDEAGIRLDALHCVVNVAGVRVYASLSTQPFLANLGPPSAAP
jgi:NAD(P)-dependent dehydrogenase (short-subunit alcohol dehydrogenase family)